MLARRLIYVMDPLCSWCFAFMPVLQRLAEIAEAEGMSLQIVAGGLRHEGEKGTGSIELTIYDNEPPCRAIVSARSLDPSKVLPFVIQLQQGFHSKGMDIMRPNLLVKLAERVGLEAAQFAQLFDSEEMRNATLDDFHWVENLGIVGFPTLLAEAKGQLALLTNGYQPLEQLEPLLKRWLVQNK